MGIGVQREAGVGVTEDTRESFASTPLRMAWVAKVCLSREIRFLIYIALFLKLLK